MEAPQDNLLIIGASCRAAAQSAVAAGFKSISAIDFFADRDLTSFATVEPIENFSAAVEAARRLPAGPWMYVGGMENYPEVIAAIAAERTLWGNSAETLGRVRDPQWFAAECAEVGLPCPEVRRELSAAEDPRNWLRKKTHSCGGLGVEVAASCEPRAGWYFQRRVTGEPASAAFVSAGDDAVLLGCSRQLIGAEFHAPRPFQYAGSYLPIRFSDKHWAALRALGRRLTRTFGLVGVWGLDFVERFPDVWPLEVNPRYCASFELLERRDSAAILALHTAACRDGVLPSDYRFGSLESFGKLIVYAETPGGVTEEVSAWLERRLRESPREFADIPSLGTQFEPGDPIATVFSRKEFSVDCFQALRRLRRELLDQFTL